MRTTFLIIILSVIFSCNEKNNKRVGIIHKTKIDSILTEKDLVDFVRKKDLSLKDFSFITPQLYKNKFYSTSRLKQKLDNMFPKYNFIKSDFDNNGYTDILLNGEIGSFYKVIVLMSHGNNKYSTTELTLPDFPTDFPVYPKLVYLNEIPIIELYTKGSYCLKQQNKIIKEKLIYNRDSFVEYNESPQEYKISKIEFERTGCNGICPVFSITLRADSMSNLNAKYYNYFPYREKLLNKLSEITKNIKDPKEQIKLKEDLLSHESKNKNILLFNKMINGNFETKLKNGEFEEICQIINYLNFDKLNKRCNVNTACSEISFLKIYYEDGTSNTIPIYSRIDIRGLRVLYQKLSDLRFNQKWKRI
jgi:hypothetical protein